MDFISPIVTPIVESLLVPIKKHLGFLVSSTKYVIDMEKKMVQLNHTEQDVQGKKKTADALNHEVSCHVSPWLEEVQKMKEKVESIPTGGIGCFSPVKRYKAGKQSYALIELIKVLKEREAEIIWTEQQKPLARVPSTFTSVSSDTRNNFESRDLIFKNALKALQSNNESEKMIALCGMGGVGKTTMLKDISIVSCNSLLNLFPTNPLPLLNHLENLVVKYCGLVKVLFNIDFERVTKMEGYSSRLRSIEVYNLAKLRELWRMRGVNNYDIRINGFKSVETIEINYCEGFTNIFTPTTTKFDLGALTTYRTPTRGEEIDLTYPSCLLHSCHHLQHLYLISDKRVGEVVFDMDTTPSSSTQQPTTIQPPLLLLPYLEDLTLQNLWKMSHVWKCNWNAFTIPQHQPEQLPFQNLTYISLSTCDKMKYLFSPLMAKYLSNLKRVWIYKCNGIEEVISNRDDENEENTTSTSSNKKITFFPSLDTLDLEDLPCLKSVDGFQSASWSLCQYPKILKIRNCNALGSLVPCYAAGQMKKLEELTIISCKRMTEVFKSDEGSAGDITAGAKLTTITIVVGHQLSNLKSVFIVECDLLQHIFTFSTFESLKQLKQLIVRSCKALQVIVKEEKGAPSELVVFPRLETIELRSLPNLMGFFLGANDFKWPSLNEVWIYDCPQLMMFTTGQSITPKLKYINSSSGYYNTECGLNFQRNREEEVDLSQEEEEEEDLSQEEEDDLSQEEGDDLRQQEEDNLSQDSEEYL